jgi:putative transposase
MTWQQSNTHDQKQKFIEAVEKNEFESFAAICSEFGITRETGYEMLRRYRESGADAFEPRSRRPLHSPQAISPAFEQHIIDVRIAHPTWGARKIRAVLMRRFPRSEWPVASSIGDLLRRRGLTHPRAPRRHVTPFTQPLAHAVTANDVWCTDFKGWFRTLDGVRCNPLTITDATSRMLLRCNHVARGTFTDVQPIFEAAFREYGLPLSMRSDNGPPFSSMGIAGLSRLSVWWVRLGIWPERIEPGCPEQNGRHERMHRTLQEEVAAKPAVNIRLQQRAFDRFRTEYNEERPHEALGQCPPCDFYSPSLRVYPNVLPPIEYPPEAQVRSVRHSGEIHWQGRMVFISAALAGERVALWEIDGGWKVYFSVIELGRFDGRTKRLTRTPPD